MSSSQADIWIAQQFMPDVPFTIAYYVDIIGAVSLDALVECGSRAHREFSSSTMRIVEIDGTPMQRFEPRETDRVEILDFREHDRPADTAMQWMNDDCRTPFSMDGQLVRLRVLRVGDDRVFWYTRAHHIALDGYASMKVLERAAALYAAASDGVEPAAIDPTTPTALVAEDERYRTSARARRDRAHWQSADLGHAEPLGRIVQPASVPIVVGEDRSVSPTAAGHATSTVVIAAFAAYLARMNDTENVDLSLPVSARPTSMLRRAGSSLSNVVPLSLPGIGSATVNNVIKSTEVAIGAVLRHQRSRPQLSESGNELSAGRFGPTINVMMFANTVAIGDFDGEINILTTGPVSDLAVNIYPGRGGARPRIDFEANPAAYTPSDLARHHARFLHFLDRFAESGYGDTAIADLDLFLPDEPCTTPASVGAAVTERGSLNDVFSTAIMQHGNRIAIQDAEVSVTYAELGSRVAALASALCARGIGTEDRVAVRIGRSVEGVVAFWAIARVGAVYVPVDPNHPRERAQFVARNSGAKLGLCPGGDDLGEMEWLNLDDVLAEGGPGDEPAPTTPHHAAYVIYTSGSTGTPKGVVVTHGGIAALVQQIRSSYGLDAESRVCHLASPGFDTAVVEVLAAATAGAAVVIAPPDSYGGAELSELIAQQTMTHLLITPSALATLDPAALSRVGTIIIGGESAPQDTVDRWSVGRRLLNAYGPTETTCSVTMTEPLNPGSADGIGRAMVGAVIHLLDRALRPVPSGAVGEIYIETPGVARGYLGRTAETAARFVANPFGSSGLRMFRSGDRARLRGDGTLEFLGRTDDQIKIRGNRVELGEVDAALRAHPEVAAASSALRRSRTGDLRIDGYIVARRPGELVDTTRIRNDLVGRLPAHMVPATISVLDEIPLTINRKIDRGALPAPDLSMLSTGHRTAPSGATEEMVAAAFSRVLDTDDVDCAASFFDLGGDSLAATRVVASIRAEASVDIGVRDLAAAPSVQSCAARIDALRLVGLQHNSRPEQGMSQGVIAIPLAPQQRHIDRSAALPLSNLPFTVSITGEFDPAAASQALTDLIERHRTLRTRYPDVDGIPVQVIEQDSAGVAPNLDVLDFDAPSVTETLEHPLDVRTEFPIRARLFALAPDHHVLACAVHHIAADGWSLGLLASDFVLAYHARMAGSAPSWPELLLQYADYSVWAVDRDVSADIDFWRAELAGVPSGTELPLDRPRPQEWDFSGARTSLRFDAPATEKMTELAQRCGTGRFTVLRAALLILLAEVTDSTDIVVGTPVAGRDDPRLEQLVGTFTNTVAIRTDIASATTVEDVVQAARGSELRAFDHASVPFEDVVADLASDTVAGQHPIFQVALSLDVFTAATLDLGDTRVEITPRPIDIAKCDLHLHVTERRDDQGKAIGIDVDIVYPTTLFDANTVVALGRNLEQIVHAMVAEPDSAWRSLAALDPSMQLLHIV
ncbi:MULTISPECIES: amino acid adenylation domain-containing protein [unclassified Rhodococcus (in: high G+C Gram-positive bacteria)]|uniref:amino acid adenylation domain-containing protein n=1 Tax=unclassified Rhodococcus (in: high G+C Gram-positive bacteria) TaxID=192944 RepID=UPI0021D13BB1|nr:MULTISPECIES: amino acid adenylation domain-containing protein [unclassified Rhodococcus (in: high G+C Gram-positive bacteria)]MDV7991728.1 amino acid adenylation domain-containing protein [Rhodococcus sp. IEGM 1374]